MKRLLLAGSNTIHTFNYYQLVKDHFDMVHVITDRQTDLFESISHDYVDFSLKKIQKIKSTIRLIKRKIIEFNPDIIHIHQAGTEAWLVLQASSKMGIPTIVSAWGSDILITPQKGILYRNMLKYILKNADTFTCDSAYVASKMQEFIPDTDLTISIANFGIDIEILERKKESIIYSNRLHKKLYRVDLIIKAFKTFSEKNKDWKLIIAGEGEETKLLKDLAAELKVDNSVEFTGWVDKKTNSEYYQKAKIYISIPESDATSISLLEAMASGCIPVLSNLPANHEWVIDGLNGIIVLDLSKNYFEDALKIDFRKARDINEFIIETRGTVKANKEVFVSIYKKILGE